MEFVGIVLCFIYFWDMRRFLLVLLSGSLIASPSFGYSDHRGHNVDSLERVVAAWTPERIAAAADAEFGTLLDAQEGLMMGYLQSTDPEANIMPESCSGPPGAGIT